MDWNEAVAELGPRLYAYFAASFAPQAASDLTQETLIRLVKKHDEGAFDPRLGSLAMFAYGIARNVRLEAWKSAPPENLFGDPRDYDLRAEDPTGAESAAGVEARSQALRAAIQDLSEVQKQIVLLHIDQDLTLQEIGALVGIPLNTVKSHIHRAKEALRKSLEKEGVFYG